MTVSRLKYWDYKILDLPIKGYVVAECGCGCGVKRLYRVIMEDRLVRVRTEHLIEFELLDRLN